MSQARGEKVKEIIRTGLGQLAAAAKGKYVYNMSELARLTGLSRSTLYKHEEFVNEVLKEMSADRRFAKGQAVLEFMRGKVERLEGEKIILKKEVEALRQCHAAIFEKLYDESVKSADLIRPVLKQESLASGRCILCGQEVDNSTFPTGGKKVVKMTPRQPKKA